MDPAPSTEGEGKVEAISRDAVTLSHGPIPTLKWGPMTMDFKPPAQGLPRNVEVGDAVSFAFTMGADGPQLTRIVPLAPQARAASGGQR